MKRLIYRKSEECVAKFIRVLHTRLLLGRKRVSIERNSVVKFAWKLGRCGEEVYTYKYFFKSRILGFA